MKVFLTILFLFVLGFVGLYGYGSHLARTIEQNHPAAGSFIEVDGIRLHYVDSGVQVEGDPTIILLHGASASLKDMTASLTPALSESFRVIAFDRPGYGYSDRPEEWPSPQTQAQLIKSALDELDVGPRFIVGHSWAGSVVMAYLSRVDRSAAGGVLLAGATHPWDSGVALRNRIAGTPIIGDIFSTAIVPIMGLGMLDAAVANVFSPEAPPVDYRKHTSIELAVRPKHFKATAEDVLELSPYLEGAVQDYEEIFAPLLMITGGLDNIVPAWNHADRVEKLLPKAKHIRLKSAGHALHHSRTNEVVRSILEFVESASSN